jgi:heme/copper-type cytochrome/quinol oxidase subunit 4
MASFNVYVQRGMASRAVALYAIPLVVSTVLMSRAALLTTAALCVAAYTTTAVSYFVLNFNEGYKIELYGEITSYSVYFVILAALLWVSIRHKPKP